MAHARDTTPFIWPTHSYPGQPAVAAPIHRECRICGDVFTIATWLCDRCDPA